MTTTTIGQQTELQAIGGGYFTESYPTNFHHFYTKKALVTGETIDMFKDVTASEKTVIEAADAKWNEPSADLQARAKAVGVEYNSVTGYFEYGEMKDLTADDLELILACGILKYPNFTSVHQSQLRTTVVVNQEWANINLRMMAGDLPEMEILNLAKNDSRVIPVSRIGDFLGTSPKLRKIGGAIDIHDIPAADGQSMLYGNLPMLSEIRLYKVTVNLDLSRCPSLSLASLQYMVDNAANTAPITITLHADAYARLTPAMFSAAAAKQITFATT